MLRHVPGTVVRLGRAACVRVVEEAGWLVRRRPAVQSTILVAGAERSGTTWLANLLATAGGLQPIQEPFSPLAQCGLLAHFDPRRLESLAAQRYSRRYLRAEDAVEHSFRDFVERVLQGRHRNYWTDVLARCMLPTRFLIKSVHANLMLGYIKQHWPVAIVLIARHPCAVVASRKRGFGGVFRQDLLEPMLAQPALVNDWLEPWVDEIRGERDPAVRHAIEWAVENAVARHSLDGVAHGRISYERLVCSPETTLPSLFAGLELDGSRAERELGRPSHTSHVSYRDAGDRLSRWRMELGRDTVRAILKWADRFGLTEIGGSTALHFPPEHGVPEETR